MKIYSFGAIYYGSYINWKHDPRPLIWIQYSNQIHTHALNIHYLSHADKAWLARTIYLIKKAGQIIDGYVFYKLLKLQRPSIIETSYRNYFTNLLNMKMVSAGITPLDKLIYTIGADPWVRALNEVLKPTELTASPDVSYYPTELQDRITQTLNATPITQKRVGQSTGAFGKAPWWKGP